MAPFDYKKNPCYEFTRTPKDGKKRCPQCWKVKDHPKAFIGRRGKVIQMCSTCSQNRAEYLKKHRERG